uniref:Cyclic nucleotide-binding domain-containing protein n=1 Tax=Ditylenchus dipsaci TaxID=166011 RepID=A0A915CZ25_9BILA
MYIIKKGEVEVMEEQTFVQSITILSDGSCFGELSILNLPGKFTDNRRTQTVRTKAHSTLCSTYVSTRSPGGLEQDEISSDDHYESDNNEPASVLRKVHKKILKLTESVDEFEKKFSECNFDLALLCPVRLKPVVDKHNDNTNINQLDEAEFKKSSVDADTWNQLIGKDCSIAFGCIQETLEYVEKLAENNSGLHVLVTGSLHLVGGVLYFQNPDIAD